MKTTDIATRQRLNSLRTKLPQNTQLSLDGVTKQLLGAGFTLPCNGDQVSHFLLEKAESGLKISTLRNYCAMIIKWHRLAGYEAAVDDIGMKAPPVIKGLRQERIEAGQREARKTATPLLLEDALKIDTYLSNTLSNAVGNQSAIAVQNLALFRLLWWSGCRESEVVTLKRWQVRFCESPRGIELNWSTTKTSQTGTGTSRFIPALPQADPMILLDWLDLYSPKHLVNDNAEDMQPLFLRQHRNGSWRERSMHPNSVPPWLRLIAKKAGVVYADQLSGHSCRHGLAMMLSDQLNLREVMDYFKWKRPDTAIGYATNKGVSQNVIRVLTLAVSHPSLANKACNKPSG